MATTQDDINGFAEFATEKLNNGGADLSLEQLVDLWRIENPSPEQVHEDILAVNAAIRDMENGDRGEPAENVIRELRHRHNIPTDA